MQLQVPESFLKGEELCDYFVSSEMKHLWAVQLGCLQELKRVCAKYNIQYFASGGTLLGAVRHGGYIPWDDDIDVMMFYDDYVRFCEIAATELSYPFFFQDFNTEPGFGPSFSRIRNSDSTGCTSYDYAMADGHYNCGVFIDIFPLFGIEDNKIDLWKQKAGIAWWKSVLSGFQTKRIARLRGWTWKKRLNPNVLLWDVVSLFMDHVKVSRNFLKACSRAKTWKQVALLSFKGFNKKMMWNKEWFDEMTNMKFEFMEITCPKNYDPILRVQYGDYTKFVRGGQIHTMVLSDPQKPFREYFKNDDRR